MKTKFNQYAVLMLLNCMFVLSLQAQQTTGVIANIVLDKAVSGNEFPIVTENKESASIRYDANDFKGVIRAIGDLQNDINSVTAQKPDLLTAESGKDYEIIIGTLGKNKWIDALVKSKKLDTKDLKGKWESFVITTIDNPQPGIKK